MTQDRLQPFDVVEVGSAWRVVTWDDKARTARVISHHDVESELALSQDGVHYADKDILAQMKEAGAVFKRGDRFLVLEAKTGKDMHGIDVKHELIAIKLDPDSTFNAKNILAVFAQLTARGTKMLHPKMVGTMDLISGGRFQPV